MQCELEGVPAKALQPWPTITPMRTATPAPTVTPTIVSANLPIRPSRQLQLAPAVEIESEIEPNPGLAVLIGVLSSVLIIVAFLAIHKLNLTR
jgi:hypothetical protein